jgi:hypothetical protein
MALSAICSVALIGIVRIISGNSYESQDHRKFKTYTIQRLNEPAPASPVSVLSEVLTKLPAGSLN